MIKKLRIKFVCVIMLIVTLLLAGILGVVLHFTQQNLQMQSISMMRSIAANPMLPGEPGEPFREENRLPFFAVQISNRGELITAGGNYALSDWEQLEQIVEHALSTDRESGELKEYELRYLKTASPMGMTLVFADTAAETASMRTMALGCLLIFLLALGLFLGVSILLSYWTIRPVEAAWDQQRQFVADASHELKTPLAVIMANGELLQNDDASPEERQKFASNILTTSYQMRTLVENMLEMARVDNGTVKINLSDVELGQLVGDAVLSFRLLYEEKGLELACHVGEEMHIQGSEQHLYQLMDVLLDNAMKYSTPGGAVRVELSRSGRHCLLSVTNPGQSISKEDLKNIFKRFYRADKARSRNGSYGLGLSIAEAIVKNHQGRIWAESRDGYNTFFVQLPLQ